MPPDEPTEALKAAVRSNSATAVAAALARYPELNGRLDEPLPDFEFAATPLLGAVYRNNPEMIDVLLRAGANINARSGWWAGGFGVLDHAGGLTDFLIERGAVIDAHAASRLGRLDRLQALVSENPALVHARGGDGQTPLHFASTIAAAEYLLARGADIDARDVDHESTPAQYMVRDRQDIARYLVSRGCSTDILMVTALGDIDRVKQHLDAEPAAVGTTVSEEYFPKQNPRSGGTIYNWTLGGGKSAHAIAREFGHDDVFRALMERTPDEWKLVIACEIGGEEVVTALLAESPDLPQRLGVREHRRLADAARDSNLEAVRLMLTVGFPVGARGQHGATALHWAGFHGDADLARELLRHDPPLAAKDQDFDGTPLSWTIHGSAHGPRCRSGNHAGVVELLLNAGAKPPELPAPADASDAVLEVLRRWRR